VFHILLIASQCILFSLKAICQCGFCASWRSEDPTLADSCGPRLDLRNAIEPGFSHIRFLDRLTEQFLYLCRIASTHSVRFDAHITQRSSLFHL
jgi:hypothetical protein